MSEMKHLARIYLRNAREHSREHAMLARRNHHHYEKMNWKEVWERMLKAASGFKDIGIQARSKVGVWSHNCPEWIFADMGALSLGAVSVPIYTTLAAAEVKYILQDSAARVLVVESPALLTRLDPHLDQLDQLWAIVLIKGEYDFKNPEAHQKIYSMEEWFDKPLDPEFQKMVEERIQADHLEETATTIYTSGTTGQPKGVVLTHGNLLANIKGILEVLPLSSKDTHLSFLPLSHVFERLCGYYLLGYARTRVAYARSIYTVLEDCHFVHPTFLLAVPRFYEKVRIEILHKMQSASHLTQKVFQWARRVGTEVADYHLKHEPAPFFLRLQRMLAEVLVYRKIRRVFGGRLRYCISGGAPLHANVGRFFSELNLFILEGYGLTETSPVISMNCLDRWRFGTVGLPLNNIEVKISNEGEILTRGPCVMKGYYNQPEETEKTIREGWLHTGDLGEFDPGGFLKITGRIKEIIILSGGKNIAPQGVEERYESCPSVARCVLYGEGKNFLTALVVPDFDCLKSLAKENNISFKDEKDLLKQPWVRELIHKEMASQDVHLAGYEQVKYFALLDKDFSVEAEELTPTLKVRRKIVCKKYSDLLEGHYAHPLGHTKTPD